MPIRRRRRKKWTWFPILGAADVQPEGTDDFNGRAWFLGPTGSGITAAVIFPLIPDVQQEAEEIQPDLPGQLVEGLGQDYEIERIVGKCFVGATAPLDAGGGEIFPKIIQVGVGLFVARQADNNTGGGPNVPIGAASAAEILENYSPLNDDNVRKPWMWQRNWILSTGRPPPVLAGVGPFMPVISNVVPTHVTAFGAPTTNMGYGSVMDGPHVDVKVNRRVRSDERLWCVAAARSLDLLFNVSPDVNQQATVNGYIQIRVLGALRRAKNRSNF